MPEESTPVPPTAADEKKFEFLWEEYQKRVAEEKAYLDLGQDIFPEPGFVLKAFTSSVGKGEHMQMVQRKVFVNLCMDPAIGPPKSEDVENSDETRLRIPMSCGPPREELDKDDGKCIAIDIVFNPKTIEDSKEDDEFRNFVCAFAIQNIQTKYDFTFTQSEYEAPLVYFFVSYSLRISAY